MGARQGTRYRVQGWQDTLATIPAPQGRVHSSYSTLRRKQQYHIWLRTHHRCSACQLHCRIYLAAPAGAACACHALSSPSSSSPPHARLDAPGRTRPARSSRRCRQTGSLSQPRPKNRHMLGRSLPWGRPCFLSRILCFQTARCHRDRPPLPSSQSAPVEINLEHQAVLLLLPLSCSFSCLPLRPLVRLGRDFPFPPPCLPSQPFVSHARPQCVAKATCLLPRALSDLFWGHSLALTGLVLSGSVLVCSANLLLELN